MHFLSRCPPQIGRRSVIVWAIDGGARLRSLDERVSRLFDLAFTLHLCAQFGHLFEVLGDFFLVDIR